MDSKKSNQYLLLSSLLVTGSLIGIFYFLQLFDETLGFVSLGQFLLWIDSLNWWASTAIWLCFWFTSLYVLRATIRTLQRILAKKEIGPP
mgnify:CR=1 FL=1